MKLHHIGILVKDIDKSAKHFVDSCGYKVVSEIIIDAVQTAKVQFLKQDASESYLELITPYDEDSKLANALKKGVTMHHICYQTDDIYADLENLKNNKFLILCQPVPAVAFPFRKIAWVMDAEKNLIELVENTDKSDILKV